MEILDRIPGIIGYSLIRTEDGSVEEERGSSTAPLGNLTAYFSSASEVIRNNLALGEIDYLSLIYGANRLVIFLYENKYLGIEIERDRDPKEFIQRIKSSAGVVAAPSIALPRSISAKVQQINLLVNEFGEENRDHWLDLLNQSLGILGGEIVSYIGIVDKQLTFKESPPAEKEDDFIQGLRYIIDFLVKKAVTEMGSSQARAKVQAVIEKMK